MNRVLLMVSIVCCLTACATQHEYRGVSDVTWRQLTAEQKQMIIDNSFHDFMHTKPKQVSAK